MLHTHYSLSFSLGNAISEVPFGLSYHISFQKPGTVWGSINGLEYPCPFSWGDTLERSQTCSTHTKMSMAQESICYQASLCSQCIRGTILAFWILWYHYQLKTPYQIAPRRFRSLSPPQNCYNDARLFLHFDCSLIWDRCSGNRHKTLIFHGFSGHRSRIRT